MKVNFIAMYLTRLSRATLVLRARMIVDLAFPVSSTVVEQVGIQEVLTTKKALNEARLEI